MGPSGGPVQGGFGRPSQTWHTINDAWCVAAEQLGSNRVHVITDKGGNAPSQITAVYASNPERPRHHPMLDNSQGRVNLTMLGAPLPEGGSWELHWASAQLYDATTFADLARLHPNCRTAGDLDLRSETGYVVDDCWDSAARRFRVTGFEIRRSVATPPSVVATVNDVTVTPQQPRIAVAPTGAPVDYVAFAYTTEVRFSVPGGPSGRDALLIDP